MDDPSLPLSPARIAKLVLVALLAFSVVVAGDLPGRSAVQAQEAGPAFSVEPDVGLVGGFDGWLPGSTVTVTVGDPANPVEIVTGHVEDGGWFRVRVGTQLTPGTLVTVTDGTTTKSHVVALLTIHVDTVTSVVSGEAEPGAIVNFRLWEWPDGPGGPSVPYEDDLVADQQGAWIVDLADLGFELNDRHFITARVFDDDGDFTAVGWDATTSSAISVNPERNEIWGGGFAIYSTVHISVDDAPAGTAQTDGGGNFTVVINQDLEAGQLVTVTDGALTRQHVILPLAILDIDVHRDTVSGVGEPHTPVMVVHEPYPNHLEAWRHTDTAADGTWSVDFSQAVSDHGLDRALDIEPGMMMTASQADEQGDATVVTQIAADAPPVEVVLDGKDDCKNGGWQTSTSPEFNNQGHCVSYFQANQRAGKK